MPSEAKAGHRARWRRAGAALALLVVTACVPATGRHGAECAPREGMAAETLLRCGCFVARSGGGAVLIEGHGDSVSDAITLVHYICPRGGGRLVRVAVVNGVVDRVIY
jgi:hypothetical protein